MLKVASSGPMHFVGFSFASRGAGDSSAVSSAGAAFGPADSNNVPRAAPWCYLNFETLFRDALPCSEVLKRGILDVATSWMRNVPSCFLVRFLIALISSPGCRRQVAVDKFDSNHRSKKFLQRGNLQNHSLSRRRFVRQH